MKTLENNKLIAEFMGIYFKNNEYQIDNENLRWMVISANSWLNDLEEQDFDFHSSWDWLMPVVEKIESLGYRIEIVKHICRIYLSNKETIIISENIPKVEAVYNACVEFIKWYNNQNKVS